MNHTRVMRRGLCISGDNGLLSLSGGERGSRRPGSRIALPLGPLGRLAHKLPQFGQERRHTGAFALERLDSLQPGQDRSRLLHAPKVGGN